MDGEYIVQQIFSCAGVVIDDNWLVYPSENGDGYDDFEWPVVSFFQNYDDQDAIMDISMEDFETAELKDGVLFINDHKIQLLTKIGIEE